MRKLTVVTLATLFVAGIGSYVLAQDEALTCEDARCRFQQRIIDECGCTDKAKSPNHGQFVSCAAHLIKDILDSPDADDLPDNCHGKLQRCAARSICGKQDRDFHTCTRVEYGVCTTTDTLTGAAACEDGTACTTNTDCVVSSRCKITRHPETCNGDGVFLDVAPTCCSPCATE